MNCEMFRENWQRFSEGDLSGPAAEEARAHMGSCAECSRFAARMESLESMLEEHFSKTVEPPPFLASRIIANLPERAEKGMWSRVLALLTLPRAAAFAAMLAMFFAGVFSAGIIRGGAESSGQFTQKIQIEFENPTAVSVGLVGDFNEWGRKEMPVETKKSGDKWIFEVELKPGRYQYAFVVDGKKWLPDPNATGIIPDGFGGMNSLLYVNNPSAPKTM